MSKKIDLSIVIVSYNTKELLRNCLNSIKKCQNEVSSEVFVSDNVSTDGSVEMLKRGFKWINLIENNENLGFAKGNNVAKKYVKGKYILFLNPDTEIYKEVLKKSINYLKGNPDVGALGCKLVLPNGELDRDARRSFPSPWVTITHLLGLDKMFPKSKLFAKYWYGYLNPDKLHEVDSLQGAFFLTYKNILDKIGWFDTDYFLNGEDIDLSWKIKNLGYKLIYFPEVKVLHVKKASKRSKKNIKQTLAGVNAMELFYKKHLWKKNNLVMNYLVLIGINVLKIIRLIKVYIS